MANEKRLIRLEDAVSLLEKDIAESKDALQYACHGEKEFILSEINGIRAAIHVLKHHASHGGTVDAVEVVRCKGCKGWCPKEIAKRYGAPRYCTLTEIPTDANDFCSYGERRADV